jgi:DNA uptake protein ComE-like DNA-binding protein
VCGRALTSCEAMGENQTHPAEPAHTERVLWPLISLFPGGLGAWAPIYGGARVGRRSWIAWGVVWTLLVIAGWVGVAVSKEYGTVDGLATAALIVGWIGANATSFIVRGSYRRALESPFAERIERAQMLLADRERARALAATDPRLAQQAGIGRPDLPEAASAGLVDVNNAPAAVLETLPGIDDAIATQIIEARAAAHGFSSLDEFGMLADLDGALVEGLRDYVVFLPRSARA